MGPITLIVLSLIVYLSLKGRLSTYIALAATPASPTPTPTPSASGQGQSRSITPSSPSKDSSIIQWQHPTVGVLTPQTPDTIVHPQELFNGTVPLNSLQSAILNALAPNLNASPLLGVMPFTPSQGPIQ